MMQLLLLLLFGPMVDFCVLAGLLLIALVSFDSFVVRSARFAA
jgi:hypothetical protein